MNCVAPLVSAFAHKPTPIHQIERGRMIYFLIEVIHIPLR